METAKEKAIREAYTQLIHKDEYERIKTFIDHNGYIDCNVSAYINENNGFSNMISNYYLPKPLIGIVNNNSWIRIESEADLPTESDKYWVIRSGVIDVGTYSTNYDKWMCSGQYYFATRQDLKITHYQQIIKPQPPIY